MKNIFKQQESKLDKNIIKLFKIKYTIGYFVIFLVLIGQNIVVYKFRNEYFKIGLLSSIIIFILIAILAISHIFILTNIKYKNYSYSINERNIVVVEGIFKKQKNIISYNVIQDININSGILMKKFGVSNLIINTISTSFKIKYISRDKAIELKNLILENKENNKIM